MAKKLHKGDTIHYGQYAEDLILDRVTGYKQTGFYVDIGANDPVHFNNTKKFYDQGWCGINVDPNPSCHEALEVERTRDINMNVGVGYNKKVANFYNFKETEISTFVRPDKLIREGFTLNEIIKVPIVSLSQVLKGANKPIDFLSIDLEGQNFEVLKSHNWKIRPHVICIENDVGDDYAKYLRPYGYRKVATTLLNSFFVLI
ncbi:MAG: methyltransferase [Parcubacteria group bacterium]|nr:methyltransferase [Parcubacteria group bacterium]